MVSMEEVHAQVQGAGTVPGVFDAVRDVEFLHKCLRKAGLDEDLISDVADACELNELDALALGCDQLTQQDAADRLFLTQDEARSLLEVCRKQCLRAGVNFGDGALYVPSPDDEWMPEPDPNALPSEAPAAGGSPRHHEDHDRRRRSSSARRSSEDGLGLTFGRKGRHSPRISPRHSYDGPSSPTSPAAPHYLESTPEEPKVVHKPHLTLAQSLSRAESARSQPHEPSNGTLASQVAIKHALKQQQKKEQAEQLAIQQQLKAEQAAAAAAAKAQQAAAAAAVKAGQAAAAAAVKAEQAAAAAAVKAAAQQRHQAAMHSASARTTGRHTPAATPSSTSASSGKPKIGTASGTPNEADSGRVPPSAAALLSVPRPLGMTFTLDGPGHERPSDGVEDIFSPPAAASTTTTANGRQPVSGTSAAAAAARRRLSATSGGYSSPYTTPQSSRVSGGPARMAPQTAALSTSTASTSKAKLRPPSAPANLPSYARPTQSTKAAITARLAEEKGEDAAMATAAALGLPTPESAPRFTHSASARLHSANHSPSKPPMASDEESSKKPKKSMFANISASLLRPTKAFLAWSSGRGKDAGGEDSQQKQFKARPLPKYMTASSMRQSVDLGSMHANGGGGGAASSYARRSQTMRTTAPAPIPAPAPTATPDRRCSLPGSGMMISEAGSNIPTTPAVSTGGATPVDAGRSGIPRPPTQQ